MSAKQGQFAISIDRQPFSVNDPILTGSQILELAGRRPPDEWRLVLVQSKGSESLRPTESVDLRHPGREAFVTHRGDRTYTFVLDGVQHEWPAPLVEVSRLIELSGLHDDGQVWLEQQGSPDRLLDNVRAAELSGTGVERFRSELAIPILVNTRTKVVHSREVSFEQIVAIALEPGQLPVGPNVVYTIVFNRGPGDRPSGSMVAGDVIRIRKGMVFNVGATDKS